MLSKKWSKGTTPVLMVKVLCMRLLKADSTPYLPYPTIYPTSIQLLSNYLSNYLSNFKQKKNYCKK